MQNRCVIHLLLTITIFSSTVTAQNRGVLTTDPAFYAVSYVEVMPGSRAVAVAALKQYRDTSSKDEGFVSLQLFEQIGWPAHFALVEKWADQKAYRSEERRVGKSVDLGGRRIIKEKKKEKDNEVETREQT